ncbi:MAG TPA: tetratricopeptide repeat protein [Burkholderiales bacterium]|nr:tetratricopeptide repeat protein [Burkholderiales bacterium]
MAPKAVEPSAKPAPPANPPPRHSISVSRGSGVTPSVNPVLSQAYGALQAGRYEDAQRLYAQIERGEPRNIDALLGLAAVAVHTGRADEAVPLYMRILESDPRNSIAQAALLALVGQEDPLAAESRLKRLLEREPSAFLYFTLGNLYAEQSQWAPAQQAYFRAHHLDPANADYTYNLAVGLEHVGQHRIALGFYRRAIELARDTGRANFNTAQAEERINTLSAQSQ